MTNLTKTIIKSMNNFPEKWKIILDIDKKDGTPINKYQHSSGIIIEKLEITFPIVHIFGIIECIKLYFAKKKLRNKVLIQIINKFDRN